MRAYLTVMDESNSIEDRIQAHSMISSESTLMVEASVCLLNSVMKSRASSALPVHVTAFLLAKLVDSNGYLQHEKTTLPDLEWQWYIFFVDVAGSSGNTQLGIKLATNGRNILTSLHTSTTPHIQPYLSYFNNLIKE